MDIVPETFYSPNRMSNLEDLVRLPSMLNPPGAPGAKPDDAERYQTAPRPASWLHNRSFEWKCIPESFCYRPLLTTVLIFTLAANGSLITRPLAAQESENPEKYEIAIVSGANLVNSVKRRVATEPIVEVHDRNKKPVGGVILTFTLPNTGPGGTFSATGSNIASVTTGANGQAAMPAFQANNIAGSYNVTVSGSVNGQQISTTIPVQNKAVPFAHSTGLKVLIVAAAAGATIGAIAAVTGGSSSNTTTVTPGTPSIGPAAVPGTHR